jgi:hypothetical protein
MTLRKKLQTAMDHPWCRHGVYLTRWGVKKGDLWHERGEEVSFNPRDSLPELRRETSQGKGQQRHSIRDKTPT